MNIVDLRTDHIEQMRTLYLEQTEAIPHCRLQTDATFFQNDYLTPGWQQTRLCNPPKAFETFVVEDAGQVAGFATLTTYQHGDDPEEQAITGLFFVDPAAGGALVQHCEKVATHEVLGAFPNAHGCTPIQPYNAGWDGLSDHLPATAHLLTRMGYRPHWRELHLAAPVAQLQVQPRPHQTSLAGMALHYIGPNRRLGTKARNCLE